MSECPNCALLQKRIAELEAHGKVIKLPDRVALGITASEGVLLDLLCNRAIATREAIIETLGAWSGRATPGIKIVDVMIWKLRHRFCDPMKIAIINHRGVGYSISDEDKAKIRAMLESRQGRKRAA